MTSAIQPLTDIAPWAKNLAQSPVFADMAASLYEDGWVFACADLREESFRIDPQGRVITVNTHGLGKRSLQKSLYFRNDACLNLIMAVETALNAPPDRGLDPLSHILLSRVQAATRICTAIYVAWDISLEGDQSLWRHCIGENFGDMALTFVDVMESKGPLADEDAAWTNAFLRYFDNAERLKICDHATLEKMDSGLLALGEDGLHVEDLGHLREDLAMRLLSSPRYMTVQDPVNLAHLRAIVSDRSTVRVAGIGFRDARLARRFFPDLETDSHLA